MSNIIKVTTPSVGLRKVALNLAKELGINTNDVYGPDHEAVTSICFDLDKKAFAFAATGSFYDDVGAEVPFERLIGELVKIGAITVVVKLNDKYEAQVTKDGVTVGCQKFPLAVIDSLVKARNQVFGGK